MTITRFFSNGSLRKVLLGSTCLIVISTVNLTASAQDVSTAVTAKNTIANGTGLNVTSSGSISVTGDYAVNNAGTVTSITNNGTITTNTNGFDAIYITSTVSGSITNNGTISNTNSNSDNDSAIEITQGYVTGTITNNGTITSSADNGIAVWGDDDDDQSDNLGVVLGGIVNNGTITAYNEGLDIDDDARINNGIINNGTITGQNNVAIEIDEQSVVNGGILNNSGGTIKSNSSDAIELRAGAILNGGITNYGTIQGDADGIYLDDSGEEKATLNGGVTNYGTITAGDDAFDFNDTSVFSGDLKNYGTIIGADKSIDFGSSVVTSGKIYNYDGGKISGLLAASPSGTVDFENAGLLALKSSVTSGSEKTTGNIGTSALKGDYVQTSTGEMNLAVNSNATAGTTYSQFNITGSATFSSNAKISLDVKNSGGNINNGDSFNNVVTTTGTLTSSSFNVTDNIMSLNFTAVNDGAGNIDITATSTGMTTVTAATTGTGGGAAKVFDNCLTNGCSDDDFTNVSNEIASLSSAGEVNSAMAQTVPILTGGMQTATMNASQGVNKVVQARLAANSGLSTGDSFVITGKAWLKPFASWADQGNRSGVAGYDVSTTGMVAGADTEIGNSLRAGIALAFAHSDVKSKASNPQKAVNNMYQLIGYGSYALDEKTEVSFQADAGIIKNNGTRHVSIGAIDRDAHANYNTRLLHAGSGIGRTFDIIEGHTLTPSLRADYTWSEDQAYTETGAGSLNLIVDKNSSSNLVLSTDVKYGFSLTEGHAIALNAGIGYDFLAGRNTITAAFQGSPTSSFDTEGMDMPKVLFNAGAGYTMDCGEACEMTMRYDTEIKQDFMSNTVSAKFRWAF